MIKWYARCIPTCMADKHHSILGRKIVVSEEPHGQIGTLRRLRVWLPEFGPSMFHDFDLLNLPQPIRRRLCLTRQYLSVTANMEE
ncbi:MAG: hypothetical protein ACLQO6_06505 [Desulfomonilaceae bacterium]